MSLEPCPRHGGDDAEIEDVRAPLEASAQEKQYEEQDKQQEEELADEDSSAQREQQDDDEKQNEHASSNRSADGGRTLYGEVVGHAEARAEVDQRGLAAAMPVRARLPARRPLAVDD